jgi:hypothetical protein
MPLTSLSRSIPATYPSCRIGLRCITIPDIGGKRLPLTSIPADAVAMTIKLTHHDLIHSISRNGC